jgi:hypothetical protein
LVHPSAQKLKTYPYVLFGLPTFHTPSAASIGAA